MSTKILLTMPQPGETITEGTVVNWLVAEGDTIKEGQHVVELETEKALFEYESPYQGKLIEILSKPGDTVHVGNPIAVFEVEDAKADSYFMLGIGKKAGDTQADQPVEVTSPQAKQEASPTQKLSPLVRRLINEYQINIQELSRISGTGPKGRITKENILNYLESRKQTVPQGSSSDEDFEIIEASPIRQRIAGHMVRSTQTIPHAHTSLTIDMTRIVEYRDQIKAAFKADKGIDLSYLALLFPCLQKAIAAHPLVNASYVEKVGKKMIKYYKKLNLGVAVGAERGLFIPVVKNADAMSFEEFNAKLDELVKKTQNDQLSVDDVVGMTFTFNNFGYFGTNIGVQIILPPQSATLGMGQIEKRPWVVEDQIKIRWISEFTLAFDHRVMDGRDAGGFLKTLKELIEGFSAPA